MQKRRRKDVADELYIVLIIFKYIVFKKTPE